MGKLKTKGVDYNTWLQGKDIYYQCKKCKGWFILKNFNIKKGVCCYCDDEKTNYEKI